MTTRIVDSQGRPIESAPSRARADGGPMPMGVPVGAFPYTASELSTQEMGNWMPYIRSPDSEINQHRDRMVARNRDLTRNDGWASGGITRILDNTVGTCLRLLASPDYRYLRARYGGTFDAVWANEFRQAAEAFWRVYSEDINRFNDVERQLTVGQQFRLAMRHKLVDGEGLAMIYWLPERMGHGGAQYATSLLLVDPDRLSNPYMQVDQAYLRGGVELDHLGAPCAYHIRKAEPNDWYLAVEANTWERVERYDDDGWLRVIHDYDRDRAGQHRGVGAFTPVLNHTKMLAKYYGLELQAAALAATFGTYVTSPYDPALVQDAMAGDADAELPMYQQMRADWARERPAMLNGVRIPTLAPGESIESVSSDHPHGNFAEFAHEMLRIVAAALGLSAEQITQDWSRTNYSSARAALMESWKTLQRRKDEFCLNFASPFYACWLWEAMDNGDLPLPAGAPSFAEAGTAYARCNWLGVARGWIDPVKEPEGSQIKVQVGLSTLKDECAEQGADYEEVIDQRAIEAQMFRERGLPLPDWFSSPQRDRMDEPREEAEVAKA